MIRCKNCGHLLIEMAPPGSNFFYHMKILDDNAPSWDEAITMRHDCLEDGCACEDPARDEVTRCAYPKCREDKDGFFCTSDDSPVQLCQYHLEQIEFLKKTLGS